MAYILPHNKSHPSQRDAKSGHAAALWPIAILYEECSLIDHSNFLVTIR